MKELRDELQALSLTWRGLLKTQLMERLSEVLTNENNGGGDNGDDVEVETGEILDPSTAAKSNYSSPDTGADSSVTTSYSSVTTIRCELQTRHCRRNLVLKTYLLLHHPFTATDGPQCLPRWSGACMCGSYANNNHRNNNPGQVDDIHIAELTIDNAVVAVDYIFTCIIF